MIAVSIFAVIIRRIAQNQPKDALKAFRRLIYLVLGAGLADYVIFDAIMEANALFFYMDGLAIIFLPLAMVTFISWTIRP